MSLIKTTLQRKSEAKPLRTSSALRFAERLIWITIIFYFRVTYSMLKLDHAKDVSIKTEDVDLLRYVITSDLIILQEGLTCA